MPTWGQILGEIRQRIDQKDPHAFDAIRNKYIRQLFEYTGRNVIIYATRCFNIV